MNYFAQYELLVRSFSTQQKCIQIDDLSTRIVNCRFDSKFPQISNPEKQPAGNDYDPELTETKLRENDSFIYPVIFSGKMSQTNEVILLFHGLNERSWNKYLVWGKYLSEQTGQPVIMFPLAFHMNRSPEKWNDPHAMLQLASYRKSLSADLKDSTYLNAAISARIENYPEQFILSGMQSYLDVVQFVSTIKMGQHPLFASNTRINIFSYSIGAFLSELLVMNNPGKLFDDTRLCLFCGGATFDHLNGISRFIMDSRAFQKLQSLSSADKFKRLRKFLEKTGISELKHVWETLRYMTFLKEGKHAREKVLNHIGRRIYAIGLYHDRVVPPLAILQTLKGPQMKLPVKVEILDFPYPYTHENPFPVNDQKIIMEVDSCFKEVFDKVAGFLK
jgi:hypothetical protein